MAIIVTLLIVSLLMAGSNAQSLQNFVGNFILQQYIKNFLNNPYKTICDAIISLSGNSNITAHCLNQLSEMCKNEERETFLKMFDATAKIPYTGMYYSGRMNLGNFDECLDIEYNKGGYKVLGNYCPIGYMIPDFKDIRNYDKAIKFAVCKPNGCTLKDIAHILNVFQYVSLFVNENLFDEFEGYCVTNESENELTVETKIIIGVLIGIAIVLLFASFYDLFCIKHNTKGNSYLRAFSAYSNIRRLFLIKEYQSGHIRILDGLRSLSILWIILVHCGLSWDSELIVPTNVDRYRNTRSSWQATYIVAGRMNVDTFFFMSGLLLSYQYFKGEIKSMSNQIRIIPVIIFRRLFRILPSVLIVFCVSVWLYPKLGFGPMWNMIVGAEVEKCKKHWLYFFTFTQNYALNSEELCIEPTWYVSADMQMFCFAVFLLIPLSAVLKRSWGFPVAIVNLIILTGIATGISIAVPIFIPNYHLDFDTHSRLVDYFIGIAFGMILRKKGRVFLPMFEKKGKKVANFVCSIIALSGILTIILLQEYNANDYLYYLVYHRIVWCLSLGWIIYSCYHSYGGFIAWFLERPIFQIISRLTFSLYLVHILAISRYVLSLREKVYFSYYQLSHMYFGNLAESLLYAIILTVMVEMPCAEIDKIIFKRKSPDLSRNGNVNGVTNDGFN